MRRRIGDLVQAVHGVTGPRVAARHEVGVHPEREPRIVVPEVVAQRLDVLAGVQQIGVVLDDTGERERAIPWLKRAAEAGGTRAMKRLAMVAFHQGKTEQTRAWLEHAAEAGETDAMALFGALLVGEGEVEKARPWLESAAEAGETYGAGILGISSVEHDRT
ncbi:hypothetical protein GTW73_24835 [Streptomyces sp. SID4982]|nr:hypothetical protein [Streptomyces sp. SID4982]